MKVGQAPLNELPNKAAHRKSQPLLAIDEFAESCQSDN